MSHSAGTSTRIRGVALGWFLATAAAGLAGAQEQEVDRHDRMMATLQEAMRLEKAGDLPAAIRAYAAAASDLERLDGPMSEHVAIVLAKQAALHEALHQEGLAEPLLERFLRIIEARTPQDPLHLATALNRLAVVRKELGRLQDAEPLYLRSLQALEKLGPDRELDRAACMNNLGELYRIMLRFEEAEGLLSRAMKIISGRPGQEEEQATCLENLSKVYHDQGRPAEAEECLRRSLLLRETKYGPDHPRVGLSLQRLAQHYSDLGQYDRAEPLYRRSLKLLEADPRPDRRSVAVAASNLANFLVARGRQDEARALFRKSQELLPDAQLGGESGRLSVEAAMAYAGKDYAATEAILWRQLKAEIAAHGPARPEIANILRNLAYAYSVRDRHEEAELLYRHSLAVGEAALGPGHPDLANTLNLLARELVSGKKSLEEILELTDRSRQIFRAYCVRVLPVLSPNEQLGFLNIHDWSAFRYALAIGDVARDDPRATAYSANWLLNGKAVILQTLAQRALLARSAARPELAATARQLQEVHRQQAELAMRPVRPEDATARRAEAEVLDHRERELARQVGLTAASGSPGSPWIRLDAVRRAVPEGASLIEIAEIFRPHDLAEPHYVAWVIPPRSRGAVEIVDLGPTGPIDAAIMGFRRAINSASGRVDRDGEPKAEAEVMGPLRTLSGLLVAPLAPRIGAAGHRWIICPEGVLWLVPWSALPLEDGRYAIEDHTISYLVSGRDLVRPAGDAAEGGEPPGRPLIVADPDYDLAPAQVRAGTDRPAAGPTASAVPARTMEPVPRNWRRLPGTAEEARLVAPALTAYAGAPPEVFLGDRALEGAVRAAARPRVAVLSTHGFFLGVAPPPADAPGAPAGRGLTPLDPFDSAMPRPGASGGPRGPAVENPLLRCGLVLAGANRRAAGAGAAVDDGLLTGLEILGTDLRGTELVVLSACETGLGEVQAGEGVAGLRQAFQLAGARSVAATLWKIPDAETARLMALFFEQLSTTRAPAEALRAAQVTVIRERRARGRAAHPFFWAAFTLTGP